jgi:peroxiredoxin
MTSCTDRALRRFLGFVLAVLVGFVVGMVQFGGLSWPAKEAAAESDTPPAPAQVAANDASGAYVLTPPTKDEQPPSAPLVGAYAPDFSLPTLDGQQVNLSDYRGQRVLVNFWASWCIPCRDEAPELQATFEAYDDFVILGVNVMDTDADARAFVAEFGFTFPLPVDADEQVMDTYRVRAIPTSFFVDREGVIQAVHLGPLTDATIADYLAQLP